MPENNEVSQSTATPEAEEVRVGVYTCYCGGNISHVVQCERVAKTVSKLDNVVVSRTDLSFCSDAGQAIIEQDIKELGVNRVVIGACAPSLHEQTFRGTVTRAGLNPFLYHHVGIREQDSWVHSNDHLGATDKAVHLMAAGIAKARLLTPLDPIRLGAERHALVIGGGVAGLRAALDIARQGIRVTLLEKTPFLGGRMAQLECLFPTSEKARVLLSELIKQVVAHPNITIFTQAKVTGVSGYVGNYEIQVHQDGRGVSDDESEALMAACTQEVPDDFNYGLTKRKVIYRAYPDCFPSTPAVDWEHYNGDPIQVNGRSVILKNETKSFALLVGAIVVATGFDPYQPRQGEYGFGELSQAITLPQFIRTLAQIPEGKPLIWNGHPVRDIAFVHCVGSREIEGVDEPHEDGQVNNYCSRVCCTATLHIMQDVQERFPNVNVFDLHEDIRTYGRGHEEYYLKTLEGGARFVRFQGTERPTVHAASPGDTHPVLVQVKDTLSYGEEVELAVDLVVLAVGMTPRPVDDLVQMLKVSRGNDRFLLEVHPKLRPVETAVNGVVLAGTAQGPMNIQESLAAASAAAAKVASLLGKGRVELPPFVARVDESKCNGTGACVEACQEEGAIALQVFQENGREIKRAVVTPANCTGCGACVGACPNRAIDVQAWTLAQYEAMVDAIGMEFDLAEVTA
ncbi:MAG: CoB--CoM heterodisulfide reductase iron-sulfur subunit A family protein [Anaerolineales bacterium]|nr:CoB--CoM heterodisulfide reductase iron-sulfur subunit A family protein [Anaerolineales bacterium]